MSGLEVRIALQGALTPTTAVAASAAALSRTRESSTRRPDCIALTLNLLPLPSQDVVEARLLSFPREEEAVLRRWKDTDAFKEQLRRTKGKPEFVFYDGPPFATGLPHYGHLLAGTIKDVVTRYASQTGHHVPRRFGWDTHGLPVEFEIDKKLGIKSRSDVEVMGIDKYNEECRSIVMRYAKEWETTVLRAGRWIDFDNDYKTMYPEFMESIWWVFKTLWDKGLVYKGTRVMPFSAACSTPLSNFEAGQNYKDVSDPAVMVTFPVVDDADGASLIAWTTTPWTLPSNLCLCVNAEFVYVRGKSPVTGSVYIAAEARLAGIPGALPKKGKKGKPEEPGWEILGTCKGSDLVGLRYVPCFDYFKNHPDAEARFWRVVSDGYVTADAGTGIVHCAPAFGEDDHRVCLAKGVVEKGGDMPCPVDDDGRFLSPVDDHVGLFVKDADKALIADLKARSRLFDASVLVHSYPYCWRSETPLIYKAVPSWYVSVERIRDRIVEHLDETHWVPDYVKDKRFRNWLEAAHDWSVSRSRFWGTPLPVWTSDDGEEVVVVGSVAELEELTGETNLGDDLHRHFVDRLTIPSKQGKGMLRRVPEVFDCWFESGSMPYAQCHYPFENKDRFENNFPADFIAEGLDQTRGWFYTLMVLSTALFDKPAFKNLVCNGLVLAGDGKKMSKRLKNYPDPMAVIEKHGADALRLYLINSPVVRAEPLRFREEGVFDTVKEVLLPWYNAYRFFVQNALRLSDATGAPFDSKNYDVASAINPTDRWLLAATRGLVRRVRKEMDAYRLYTVVPALVTYIEQLTNVYVRFNRRRLKGGKGNDDAGVGLACLHSSLDTLCRLMAPFTPFFCDMVWQNLRKLDLSLPGSVHHVDLPSADAATETAADRRIGASMSAMMNVIEQVRLLRDKHRRPVKTPVARLVVVHPDPDFLEDVSGELSDYVLGECNAQRLETCADVRAWCDEQAVPDWGLLGKRLGKDMGKVKKALAELTGDDLAALARDGSLTVAGHVVSSAEVQLKRTFRAGENGNTMDASGDGELLVVVDLAVDRSMLLAGLGREVAGRFQQLRKRAGLRPGDSVTYRLAPRDDASAALWMEVKAIAASAIADTLGAVPGLVSDAPSWAVVLASDVDAPPASAGELSLAINVSLAVPCVRVRPGMSENVGLWLASQSLSGIAARGEQGVTFRVRLDGTDISLTRGEDFWLPGE